MTTEDGSGFEAADGRVVPLFPLPQTTLFPRVKLPFYVFEPRYRAMLAAALDGDGLIAVPMLRGDGRTTLEGRPAFHDVFGVGRVLDYETHDDGTSHIELLGVGRARAVEETPTSPYRSARLAVLADVDPSPADARSLRGDLQAAFGRLERLGMSPEAKKSLDELFARSGDDCAFLVNVMTTVVVGNPAVRQSLLEEDRVYERGRHLATLLETLRQELEGRDPRDPRDRPAT